jgi:hypothetical protein
LGKDVRNQVESIRPKFIFFTFIGSEVPVLQRARVSVQRPDVEKLFNGYSVRMDISGGNQGTFSKAEIAKELLRCTYYSSSAQSCKHACTPFPA